MHQNSSLGKEINYMDAQSQEQLHSQLQRVPIAIIGMSALFPKAKNLQEYWDNIIGKVDCITDIPTSRWNIDDYYDPDPTVPDKTYCKRGGFIPDIDFNPLEFGLPPNILEVTDIAQLLSLVVAKAAMEDAGYGESKNFSSDIHDKLRPKLNSLVIQSTPTAVISPASAGATFSTPPTGARTRLGVDASAGGKVYRT